MLGKMGGWVCVCACMGVCASANLTLSGIFKEGKYSLFQIVSTIFSYSKMIPRCKGERSLGVVMVELRGGVHGHGTL